MGCKCKENGEKLGKYTEDGKSPLKQLKGLMKAVAVLLRVLLAIFVFLIVIVALPFVVLYVIIMVVFGKEVKINLRKLFRFKDGKQ